VLHLGGILIALLPIVAVIIAFCVYFYYTKWRDQWVRSRPFPEEWLAFLAEGLVVYSRLSLEEQHRLRQLILVFLARKKFYGCAGLVVTDQMRIIIAAEACLLLLNQGWAVYPKLSSVLVYPSAFRVTRDEVQADGVVSSGDHHLLGESWGSGRVILSWDDVENGATDFTDGHNVVLHEFAHQLDAESGHTNGAPPLRQNSYKSWSKVFAENFEDLRERSRRRQKTVMDVYGATNPAEFFAVATETFFEEPHQLHDKRPDLYEELCHYYQLDPRDWHQKSASQGATTRHE
jgi:Mlc titration factor MtfA (ptsG expression regulator)